MTFILKKTMKTKYGYFFAAFAVIISLASCSLEIIEPETGTGSATDGMRVITLAYAESSKAELSGLQPVFKANDVIKVSNGSESEDCTVFLDSRSNPVIETALRGTLTAVFPATAAVMTGNEITGVSVPAGQSGKFTDAIISKADNIDNTARFVPQTAILRFYVGGEIEVQSFMVASSSGDVATGSNVVIVSESFTSTSSSNHLYSRNWSPMDPRICYMAVNAGVNAGNLTFTGVTLSQGTVSKKCTVNVTLEAGHLYDAFLPYYVDMGAGGKWSYCNIGAFLPEDYGEYFMWGEVKGHKPSGTGSYAFDFSSFDHSDSRYPTGFNANDGFATCNAPFYIGPTDADWSKYNNTDFYTTVTLAAEDDAAAVNWGGSWRMPTKAEYETLLKECEDKNDNAEEHGVNVVMIERDVYKKLYFPKAGYGINRDLSFIGTKYRYWTSTQSNGNPRAAYDFVKLDWMESTTEYRRSGSSIRPVSDGAGQPALFSVWTNDKVQFTKGNLYWDGSSGSYKMESNQYDYRNYNGKTNDKAVINGAATTTPANTVGSFWWVKNGETNFNPYDATYGTPSTGGDFRIEYLFTNNGDDSADENFTVNGETGKYRVLSSSEWRYLLGDEYKDHRDGNSFALAKVKGVTGVLIFPDGYTTVPSDAGIGQVNKWDASAFPSVSVADYTWKYLESTGVVFLPAAGNRDNSKVMEVDEVIEYWCSGHSDKTTVNYLCYPPQFNKQVYYNGSPSCGRPIRLVYDAN